jgi:hypothetical protein
MLSTDGYARPDASMEKQENKVFSAIPQLLG